MKYAKFVLQIILLLAVAGGLAACSKKKSKSSLRARAARTYDPANPHTPPVGSSANGGYAAWGNTWGQIYGFRNEDVIYLFDIAPQELGHLENGRNGQTGMRFFGAINDYQQAGFIELRVYDSIAVQGGQPFALLYENCQSRVMNTEVSVTCYDEVSSISLNGFVNEQHMLRGQIRYAYDGYMPRILGEFEIPACGLIICQ